MFVKRGFYVALSAFKFSKNELWSSRKEWKTVGQKVRN